MIDPDDLPGDGEPLDESIRQVLDLDPEAAVFAFVDEGASGAFFEIPDDGTLEDEVKAVGVLIMKIAAQTDKPPRLVADDAAGLAEHLLSHG